jgi:hypothetical protein
MRRFATLSLFLLVAVCLAGSTAFAQVRTSGQLVGVVEDPTGAVIPGAKIVVLSESGVQKEVSSGADGKFIVTELLFGNYKLTVSSEGFRTAVFPNIKIEAGITANLTVKLEVGATAETITVESGTEVLQTTSPTVESVIPGSIVRNVPLNTRDLLDFVVLLPGAQQAGTARQTTFNGLPKGALNITMDGLNIQDNLLKSSSGGGMFTLIRPKIDTVEEIAVSTAVGGADAGGEGAVQIKFVTRRGTNEYHGGVFWDHRHESYNANTWINNANGLTRNKNRLQQYGANIGGPIIRDKAFFFFNYEDFRLPEGRQRNNRVLTMEAQSGLFRYNPTATQGAAPNAFTTCGAGAAPTQECVVDLFALAGNASLPNTIDPTVAAHLATINPIVASGRSTGTLFYDRFIYSANAGQRRWFPTLRMDWNVTDKLRWHGVANFNKFNSNPDTLNRMDPAFPGTGFEGGQYSNRMSLVTGLTWEVAPTVTYSMTVGRQSSVVQFFPETLPGSSSSAMFPDGYRMAWPFGLANLHSRPSATDGAGVAVRSFPSSRTVPVLQWTNNVGWLKGKHSINIGSTLSVITHWDGSYGTAGVPTVNFGLISPDPALSTIASANIPGLATGTDQTNARNLYAMLTGRISTIAGSTNVDEVTKTYSPFSPLTQRNRQNEFGLYITDSYRLFPELTVTAGLRWEYQGSPFNRNDLYTSPTFEDIWGPSGINNLFQPGASSGIANGNLGQLQQRSTGFHRTFKKAFAPTLGLAWTPKFEGTLSRWILGGPSKSVFRAGYSIAYTREGFNHFTTFAGGNPGSTQANSAGIAAGNMPVGTLIRNGLAAATANQSNSPATFSFPVNFCNPTGSGSCFTFNNSLNTYDPKIRPPYVQSWQFSWQRELSPSMVVEARYVGNHGTALWRSYGLNETNIFENNFLPEFINAQNNLAICTANRVACTGSATGALRFNNVGLPGQVALPIFEAAFGAVPNTTAGTFASAVAATSAFQSSAFITLLNQGEAGELANTLASSSTYTCRFAGNQFQACQNLNGLANPLGLGLFPANLFRVNPFLTNSFILTNDANSTYNSLQLELRRRPSKGLTLSWNYTFNKSLTDRYDDSAISNLQFSTLRDKQFDKGLSPYDLTHTMRMFWAYEMPFGAGKRWSSGNPIVNRVIGGWQFLGTLGFQTGRPFLLTSNRNTVNQNGAYVVPLVSRKQLQKMVKIHKVDGRKFVYFLDPSLIGSGAFPTGTSTSAQANSAFLDVPTTPGEWGQQIFLHGPGFFKPDFTIKKVTDITERISTEFTVDFFNAVNNTNWLVGGPGAVADTMNIESNSFGQTTNFLNDLGNQDQGPRMIQFRFRIKF